MPDKVWSLLKVPLNLRGNARVEIDAPTGAPNGASLTLYARGRIGIGDRKNFLDPPVLLVGACHVPLQPAGVLGSQQGRSYVQVSALVVQPSNAGADFILKGRLVLPDANIREELWDEFKLDAGSHSGIIDLTWWIDE
ncbi:hypothetical protein FJV41_34365 [Myxococcus llanfairpwllgwyngyllgogerychwyrndrobwllllantysiliogogogochensis]|uniref:Uncharacterized protein n=1 Tax=Myxococcus llanfairpwllgwyngyllgogerychwyrndrobwllllantysiliogogogochensis TaxID=2590453 RepID=A0A540WQY3_9BACT|nr:hypothetical protein [Myxococcus llanfairpwllgwyngyllgogerychwyrndrobwllllantysiliogogogochensis]TQF11419.1 hypothetical protein FJV41_34365 [Myxococcus llanfairpwllgwyngyllgogerychwyrndrobwllllantysiliogogogochensis]